MTPARRGRAVLDAVARAVARADDRHVGDELGPVARWRVARARRWADRRVPAAGADPAGEQVHRLRVTWLRLAGLVGDDDPAATDAAVARARFHAANDALGPRPEPRRWSPRAKLIGLVAVAGVAVASVLVVRAVSAPEAPVGDAAHLPPEHEEAFADALTEWSIGLDRLTRTRFDGALDRAVQEAADALATRRHRLLSPELRTFLGGEATDALVAVLDEAERTALGRRWEAQEEVFAEAVRALNRALADAGRGYFVDSYAALYRDGRPETALFLFRVAARRTWRVDGPDAHDPVDALHLRRLDRLNIVQHLLGYTSRRMDVAALLLDQLEDEVLTRVGPSLEPGRPMPFDRAGRLEASDAAWIEPVTRVAGERIREAFADELPGDREGLAAFGALLGQRKALVDGWNADLAGRGVRLSADRYELSDALLDDLERWVGGRERRRLEALQDTLLEPEHRQRFAAVLARHARPVEQHEVQHRLDYGLGPAFRAPAALLDLLGVAADSPLARDEQVLRQALELSAYTSEIARDPRWAAVNLTLLTEHVLTGGGGAEGHAAVLVLDGLREELGLPGLRLVDTPPVTAARAAEAYLALMQVPGDNLARAAAALWTRWFGRALPLLQPEAPSP